ncbi:MAG TPA: cytochrome c3 family protein [Longimicrobiales bacterium]|nr:cytochrome c3 family protein [Longimicrobiales bacterium]
MLMRRALAILAVSLAACSPEPRPEAAADGGGDIALADPTSAHRGMACASCHIGARADSGRASVPREACMASGCHDDGGPELVRSGTVTFQHRDHGREGEVQATCAGCHDHHAPSAALHVDVDACALCHVAEVSGAEPGDCRLCHQQPKHVAMTSQALPVPHSSLPWIETGCVRCHYDVARPPTRVSTQRCARCHTDVARVTQQGIGENLHPEHQGVGCTSCHESGAHQVRAMSSAVTLVCADCHTREHGLALTARSPDASLCASCHQTVHQAQQRMLLGVLGDGEAAAPSTKFLAGITCRSCHVREPGTAVADEAIRGQAEACAGCHTREYRRVLDWWLEGTRERSRVMLAFTARAQRELATAPDTAQRLLRSAQRMVALVDEAGGQHNLELADRIFRESSARTLEAYRLAGRSAPGAPALGPTAHEGLCSYCHYSPNDPWNFRRMPADFHERVLGKNREEASP